MTKTVRLQLEKLACPTCAAKIGQVLERSEGVSRASVNFATAKATVEYDPEQIDLEKISALIGSLGYRVLDS